MTKRKIVASVAKSWLSAFLLLGRKQPSIPLIILKKMDVKLMMTTTTTTTTIMIMIIIMNMIMIMIMIMIMTET